MNVDAFIGGQEKLEGYLQKEWVHDLKRSGYRLRTKDQRAGPSELHTESLEKLSRS